MNDLDKDVEFPYPEDGYVKEWMDVLYPFGVFEKNYPTPLESLYEKLKKSLRKK